MDDKLRALLAKKEKYVLPGTDKEVELQGITFSELSKLGVYSDKGDNSGAANYLLFTALRKAFTNDEFNDDELKTFIGNMASKPAGDIIAKIMEISDLEVPKGFQK